MDLGKKASHWNNSQYPYAHLIYVNLEVGNVFKGLEREDMTSVPGASSSPLSLFRNNKAGPYPKSFTMRHLYVVFLALLCLASTSIFALPVKTRRSQHVDSHSPAERSAGRPFIVRSYYPRDIFLNRQVREYRPYCRFSLLETRQNKGKATKKPTLPSINSKLRNQILAWIDEAAKAAGNPENGVYPSWEKGSEKIHGLITSNYPHCVVETRKPTRKDGSVVYQASIQCSGGKPVIFPFWDITPGTPGKPPTAPEILASLELWWSCRINGNGLLYDLYVWIVVLVSLRIMEACLHTRTYLRHKSLVARSDDWTRATPCTYTVVIQISVETPVDTHPTQQIHPIPSPALSRPASRFSVIVWVPRRPAAHLEFHRSQ
ncbi:hypothetical protein CC1G_05345 [Coprinopsis cinerea okayama7|uniref:Uncharacterized protein n=1 Tax=Coprinopsis cinerea (strain Okayama-7 / 130 / ATCC MYA-4618 / FGSC 9003) TaxID=240176 RepID=A8NPR6_COPC7|nr:hypothetical protein CC1G_05345 [Coprinopsis cinerea okayama7\|eukprot:XP_001835383.2 hypothetical protein CC1G_05345 [Coprinopsis cinerea okayama7\